MDLIYSRKCLYLVCSLGRSENTCGMRKNRFQGRYAAGAQSRIELDSVEYVKHGSTESSCCFNKMSYQDGAEQPLMSN
jgi:hypothetical protein